MHIDLPTSEEAYRDDIDMRSRCGIYVVTFCCAYFGISLFISRILLHILTYCLSSGCSVNITFPIWKYIILRILHVSQEYCWVLRAYCDYIIISSFWGKSSPRIGGNRSVIRRFRSARRRRVVRLAVRLRPRLVLELTGRLPEAEAQGQGTEASGR